MAHALVRSISRMPKKEQKRTLPTTLRAIVAGNVKRAMHKSGYTSGKALAADCGIGKRTVERLMKGDRAAQLDTIEVVANKLKVSAWELLVDRRQDDGITLRGKEPSSSERQVEISLARKKMGR